MSGGLSKRLGRALATAAASAMALAATVGSPPAAASSPEQWTSTRLPGLASELFLLSVSCPSASLCVATGTQNVIASSTEPMGGTGAWNVVYAGEGFYKSPSGPVISSRQIQGVSCPTTRLCVAVTTLGQIYATRDPTGPASSWSVTEIVGTGKGNTHLYGISCPTASLCVAVSGRRQNKGKVFTSTDPTGGPGAWAETNLGEIFDLRAVSCSSTHFCVAAGANGELVGSTDPTGGPAAWSSIGAPAGSGTLQAITCLSALCLTGNSAGDIITSTNPLDEGSWRQQDGGGSVQITGTSCALPLACIAVDENGHVITSTEPGGPSSAWTNTNLVPYTPEAEEFDPENGNALFGVSCRSISFCALVGSGGRIFTSTSPFAQPASAGKGGKVGRKVRRPIRPRTVIAKFEPPAPREVRKGRGRVFLRFYANGPVLRFQCSLDRRRFSRCHSPEHYLVANGTHRLRIRAIGRTGLRGPATRIRFWTGQKCTVRECLEGGGELPSGRG